MTVYLEPIRPRESELSEVGAEVLIRIVDDNRATCQSLAFFLEALGYKVRIWNDPQQFLSEYEKFQEVGCLILDIRMPGLSGIELHDLLMEQGFDLPIIFLTGHGDVEMAVESVKKGAFDFLLKPPNEEKITKTIGAAVEYSFRVHAAKNQRTKNLEIFDSLTPREKEVVLLVAQGKLNKIIAAELNISEKTVQQHRGVACHKLRVRSVADLIEFLESIGKK